MSAFLDQLIENFRFIGSLSADDIYTFIFGSAPFPFWFVVQATWWCYLIFRSCVYFSSNGLMVVKKLVVCFSAVFASREFYAFVTQSPSPIITRFMSLPTFLLIFILFNFTNGNVYYLFNKIRPILAIFASLEQIRYFTLILRLSSKFNGNIKLFVALFFGFFDQFFTSVLLFSFRWNNLHPSSFITLIRSIVVSSLYWMATRESYITPYVGTFPIRQASLVLCLVQSILNVIEVLRTEKNPYQGKKNKKTRHYE